MTGLGHPFTDGALCDCVPYRGHGDQTPVDVQERLGREYAASIGLTVPARMVFVDRLRSTWNPGAARPGWAGPLAAARGGRVGAAVVFRPRTLMHHRTADAVELLVTAQELALRLHGFGDHLDLSGPETLASALEQARRLQRKAASVSQTARVAHLKAAGEERAHGGGRRALGYQPGMLAPIDAEAGVVREIYARYLSGDSLRAIARDLNERGVPTAADSSWTTTGIDRILAAPRYAALRVFRGSAESDGGYRDAMWEPCVSVEDWQRAQSERAGRSAASGGRGRAAYLSTGLVMCDQCRDHMVGSIVSGYVMYACASQGAHVLEGVVIGTDAPDAWTRLPDERRRVVLRFLFASVEIGAKTTSRSVFDTSRINILPNPLLGPDGGGHPPAQRACDENPDETIIR